MRDGKRKDKEIMVGIMREERDNKKCVSAFFILITLSTQFKEEIR